MQEELAAAYAESRAEMDRLGLQRPGPELLNGLLDLQPALVSDADSLRVVALWSRLGTWVDAQAMRALSQCCPSSSDPGDAALTVHEVAAMTHTSEVSTSHGLAMMLQVRDGLPLCWEAMDAATLTLAHVKALASVLSVVPSETSIRVEAVVVPQAVAAGWTPAQLRRAARRALIAVDPDGAADGAEVAREHADIRLYGEDQEMASLVATADAVTSRLVMDAIDAAAAGLRRDGDARPIGQLRVAALAGAVLGEQATAPRVEAVIEIDLTTWLGLTRRPGELAGYGPISAELARTLSKDATIRRLITDPLSSESLDLGRNSYRPSEALRRFITTRDRTCRFPGCMRRALRCDIDHCIDYEALGTTDRRNLHCLCRTHHNLKTLKQWHVDIHPDGTETWTSRYGYTYTTPPARQPVVTLVPPEDPYPGVECPGISEPTPADLGLLDDDIPPGDPPPLDNEDREHAERIIDEQLWQRFDDACYANYWQHRAAS
jgi:hypothetical protein